MAEYPLRTSFAFSRISRACLFAAALASCGSPDMGSSDLASNAPSTETTESIQVALTAIPASLRCVRFTAVAGGRTFEQDFDITGVATLTAPVRGLPANLAMSISADAFPVACTAVTATTQATWISAPVSVTLVPGVVPMVSFVLRPAGGVTGDVNFLFLASTPASKAFPSLTIGQSSPVTFTVQNIGPAPTGALTASLGGTGASQFTIGTNGCTAALPAAGTCTIQVSFTPTTAGAKAATLQLTGAPGGTLPIALTGTALQPAVLAITPPMQSFGNVAVGHPSPLVTYTVTNTGGTTTAPVAVTSSDPAFVVSGSTCDVLTQSQTCTFKVQFAPTVIASKTATITATAGTVAATATATGVGVAAPALALSPSTLAFGTVVIGEPPKQILVTVTNVGGLPLSPISAFIGGGTSGPFTVNLGPCMTSIPQGTLAPGATCPILVNAVGSDMFGGPTANIAATLLVNAGGTTPASVMAPVTATVSWPVVPDVTSFNFGPVPVGTSSSAVTFVLTNVSSRAQGPFTFTSSNPAVFTLGPSSCSSFGFAPGTTCTVSARYNAPATAGPSVGALTVSPVPGVSTFGITLRGLATSP